VQGVAAGGRHLGAVGVAVRQRGEAGARLGEQPLAVQRAPHGQPQLQVVVQPHGVDGGEALQRLVDPAELQQRLAQPHPRVLVLGVQVQRLLERQARPRVLLAGDAHVTQPHVQQRRVRVVPQPVAENVQRVVVVARLVQPVRLLVELFRAQE